MVVLYLLFACSAGSVKLGHRDDDDSGAQDTASADTDTGPADTGGVDTGDTSETDTGGADTADTVDSPVVIALDLLLPSSGSTLGGDTVTIYGGPFAADAVVTFDGAAASVASWTATTLSVVTPAGEEGSADVAVVTSAGAGAAGAAFAYEEPCLGVTADPASLRMDLQSVNDATVTLSGCATGIHVAYQIENALEFESYPSSVDGTGTVVVRHYGSSDRGGYADWTITLGSDQGDISIDVHVD